MLRLPNNCKASEPKVLPATWSRLNASVKKNWQIWYRFYDPEQTAKYPKGKMVVAKGMNKYKTLAERQGVTKDLLEQTLSLLHAGYNPHSDTIVYPELETYMVAPTTLLPAALMATFKLIAKAKNTMKDIQAILRQIAPYWVKTRLDLKQVGQVTKRDLKGLQTALLQSGKFSHNRINVFMTYLSILFAELEEMEALPANPCTGIKKLKTVKRIRETLTLEERAAVDQHLAIVNPSFRRFLHIYFHTGCRIRELLEVRGKDVNLKTQQIKVTVLKGGSPHEAIRPIKTIALPFWEEVLKDCALSDYVFSEGLEPGEHIIRYEQICRRWRYWVKDKKRGLGITADFASVRHSNLDEMTSILSMKEAAKFAGHSGTQMLERHYAVGEEARAKERMKEVNNPFA